MDIVNSNRQNELNPDTNVEPAEPNKDRQICNFWIRILALVIDGAILSAFGMILGLIFGKYFISLGGWGRAIGFVVALLYFGLLNSTVGSGQSLGKRITKISVVGEDGKSISILRSLCRSTILELPFFLNRAMISPALLNSIITIVFALIVFGIGGSIIYLYIFNRRTRQSFHDFVCGTYVVNASVPGHIMVGSLSRIHYVVISGWLLCVLLFTTVIAPKMASQTEIMNTLSIQLYQMENVAGVSVSIGTASGPQGSNRYVAARVILRREPQDIESTAEQVARVILNAGPSISAEEDVIVVSVVYGYDIGIAGSWKGYSDRLSPAEWRERLEQKDTD